MQGANNWLWTVDPGFSGQAYIHSPSSSSTFIDVKGGGGVSVKYTDQCGETAKNGVTIYSSCFTSAVTANIYPNPTTSIVNVDFNLKQSNSSANNPHLQAVLLPETVELFTGKTAKAISLQTKKDIIQNGNKAVFNVDQLAPGFYFIHINYQNNVIEKTIEVN